MKYTREQINYFMDEIDNNLINYDTLRDLYSDLFKTYEYTNREATGAMLGIGTLTVYDTIGKQPKYITRNIKRVMHLYKAMIGRYIFESLVPAYELDKPLTDLDHARTLLGIKKGGGE